MKYRISYLDNRSDEFVSVEYEFMSQVTRALTLLDNVVWAENVEWEKI